METSMQTNYFFGSNTPFGFAPAHGEVLAADTLVILKGGAGTGKSTLMKKAATVAAHAGYDTVLYHCSSDENSLDGVYIKSLNSAVVDGTAPHVIEAEVPLCKHFVFNLLDKADKNKIKAHTSAVENCMIYNKQYFTNAYCYLNCAYRLQDNLNSLIIDNIDRLDVINIASDIYDKIKADCAPGAKTLRYCSAISDKGPYNYYDNNFEGYNVYYLDTEYDIVGAEVLRRIIAKLDYDGIQHTVLLNPMLKECPEGIIVSNNLVGYKYSSDNAYDLKMALKPFNRHFVSSDTPVVENLINMAVTNIGYAHRSHTEIEKRYYECMEWADVNEKTEQIITLLMNC